MAVVPFSENGGFAATNSYLFVPVQSFDQGSVYVGIYDITDFDDDLDSSSYFYRAEDVTVGRVPTIRRIILVYRDLGIATITVGVQGVDDNNALVVSSKREQIGTKAATQLLLTRFVDLTISAFRPQLFILRAAAGGPVSIISATMVGEIEEASL